MKRPRMNPTTSVLTELMALHQGLGKEQMAMRLIHHFRVTAPDYEGAHTEALRELFQFIAGECSSAALQSLLENKLYNAMDVVLWLYYSDKVTAQAMLTLFSDAGVVYDMNSVTYSTMFARTLENWAKLRKCDLINTIISCWHRMYNVPIELRCMRAPLLIDSWCPHCTACIVSIYEMQDSDAHFWLEEVASFFDFQSICPLKNKCNYQRGEVHPGPILIGLLARAINRFPNVRVPMELVASLHPLILPILKEWISVKKPKHVLSTLLSLDTKQQSTKYLASRTVKVATTLQIKEDLGYLLCFPPEKERVEALFDVENWSQAFIPSRETILAHYLKYPKGLVPLMHAEDFLVPATGKEQHCRLLALIKKTEGDPLNFAIKHLWCKFPEIFFWASGVPTLLRFRNPAKLTIKNSRTLMEVRNMVFWGICTPLLLGNQRSPGCVLSLIDASVLRLIINFVFT